MSNIIYTFEDWFDGKVILVYSRTEFNRNELPVPIYVTWDNFSKDDQLKVQNKQKEIFTELLNKSIKNCLHNFFLSCKRSKILSVFIEAQLKELNEIWHGKYICENGFCHSRDKDVQLTYDENHYKEMMEVKRNCIISGVKSEFEGVQSPKSKYQDHSTELPEITIFKVFKMITYVNNYKKDKIISKTLSGANHQQDPTVGRAQNNESENLSCSKAKFNSSPLSDGIIFKGEKEYNFFLLCLEKIPNKGRKKKNDSLKVSELQKYSAIFNFMIRKELILDNTTHKSFIKYVIEHHDAQIEKDCKKLPYQPSESADTLLKTMYDRY